MAVIKIVPMPGAVGDKGDEGAVGPRGLQGEQGLQGAPGADALWNYNGAYNPGAGYAVGDVVTYNGQTWYRKHANGGNVGDTPSQGIFWDLVAAKGADGTNGTNGTNGADSITPTSGTWDTKFAFHSGIDVSTTNVGYESGKMGYYYCIGDLVYWEFRMLMQTPVSWGTNSTWAFELPFAPYYNNDSTGNAALRNSFNRTIANGWFRVLSDSDPTGVPGSILEPGNSYGENELHIVNASAILRTYARTEGGGYSNILAGYPYPAQWPADANLVGIATMHALNQEPETDLLPGYPGNPRTVGYKSINATWPANLAQAFADQNDNTPANNSSEENPLGFNQNGIQFNFSGVYRKA
jgi:hypothetical protein